MYKVQKGQFRHVLFSENSHGKQRALFTRKSVEQITNTLLTRKQRNNGVGRAYLFTLMHSGQNTFEFSASDQKLGLGFSTWKVAGFSNTYEYFLLGEEPAKLLTRLNRPFTDARAAENTRLTREQRRYLRSQGIYEGEAPPLKKAIAGANGRLVAHFHKSPLTLGQVITAIAHALGWSEDEVRVKLQQSYDDRGAATIRLGGFVFRVDFVMSDSSLASPLDSEATTRVVIRTTKDNAHPAYRRLRDHLRRKLGCVSRAKQEQRAEYQKGRKFQRAARILLGASVRAA